MRWRPSSRVTATAAIVIAALVVAGCEAKGYGTPPDSDTPQLTVVAPQNNTLPMPEAPPEAPSGGFDGLDARTKQAVADAAKSGADISVVVLDRDTGQTVSGGDGSSFPIASVVKLFIADDLLLKESKGETTLSPADRKALDVMLRSSDDGAAQNFWDRLGGNAVIARVKARYGLRRHDGAVERALGRHHKHRKRSRPLLRHAARRQRRACHPSRPTSSWATSRSRRRPDSTATHSVSVSQRGSTPSLSRSSRAGSAAGTVGTSCTSPPVR